jgi:hypothetical protein
MAVGPSRARTLAGAVDWLSLTGAVAALAGFLLPWFKRGADYEWWYSGWFYLQIAAERNLAGGWTLPAVLLFAVAAGAALGSLRAPAASYTTAVAGIAGVLWSTVAVAAAFGAMTDPADGAAGSVGQNFARVAVAPLGVGFPLLALGAALLVTGAIRTVVTHALRRDDGPR